MGTLNHDLAALQVQVEARARAAGLDVPEIVYEVVDHRQLNEIAAYGGFPVRYPHWRFGMEYDRLIKGHTYGLQRIYELVVNTRPVLAYLLSQNGPVEQKLVMAHVCGHADFFVHNAWYSHTEGNMLDVLASHGSRVRALMDRHGLQPVEDFIDTVLSLDNLVDVGAMGWAAGQPGNAPPLDRSVPPGDVLGFLLLNAPLAGWQQELVSMLRDEAYYFLPQGLTKIMNEGWASFWHSRLMTGELLRDAEVVDYADQHSGALGGSDGPMNPYKLGIELFHHLAARHGGVDHGGLAAAFEARAIHNDLTFVDSVLDEDFAMSRRMLDDPRGFPALKEGLLTQLTHGGQPVIRLAEGTGVDGELELEHCWSGAELELSQAGETLAALAKLWQGTVRLRTRVDGRALLLSCVDGELSRELGEAGEGDGRSAAGRAPGEAA